MKKHRCLDRSFMASFVRGKKRVLYNYCDNGRKNDTTVTIIISVINS